MSGSPENPPYQGGKAPQAPGGVSVAATPGTSYRDIPLVFPHGNAVPLRRGNIFILCGAVLGGMSDSHENPLLGGERRLQPSGVVPFVRNNPPRHPFKWRGIPFSCSMAPLRRHGELL